MNIKFLWRYGIGLCLLLGMGPVGLADTHYVRPGETCTNTVLQSPYTSWDSAATQIQWAVEVAVNGDTVLVSNGVYNTGGTNNARVYINRTNVTLVAVSTNPADTLIVGASDNGTNGPNALRCIILAKNDITISGFTLTNGWTTQGTDGGGIHPSGWPVRLLVTNCYIVNCVADRYAGGADYYAGVGTTFTTNCVFSWCTFIGNRAMNGSAGYAGGVYQVFLTNCTLINNLATNSGGGAWYSDVYNSTILCNTSSALGGGLFDCKAANCLIASNAALVYVSGSRGYGGGIWDELGRTYSNCVLIGNTAPFGAGACFRSNSRMVNCMLVGNYSTVNGSAGAAVYRETAYTNIYLINCTVVSNWVTGGSSGSAGFEEGIGLINCIIWHNLRNGVSNNWNTTKDKFSFSYCNVYPLPTGVTNNGGNINANPLFVAPFDNCRLAPTSPCINSGTNQDWMFGVVDLDGRHRVDGFGGVVDMGCYEYLSQGMKFSFR